MNKNNLRILTRFVLAVQCVCLWQSSSLQVLATNSSSDIFEESPSSNHNASDTKALRICSISEGLNIARLVSSNTRNLFRDATLDVELIREYISEAAFNGGIVGGLHTLAELSETLDWEARGLSPQDTTVSAGLGYTDDRPNRRIERYVGLDGAPFVGDKASDIALIDSASNIFPWIVDRRSIEDKWYLAHQNGRSARKHRDFERLYVAAWIGTKGEAWLYYPPFTKAHPDNQPMGLGDVLGPRYNSQEEEFVKPNLPENNPERISYFTSPYPDTAVPGLSLITAQAPIYFTGEFQGHVYNHTYVASTGVDISVASMSTLLEELEDTMTEGSFAFLVHVEDFRMVAISQSTVEKIYPQRTGFEEERVTYDTANGSVIEDRRNQTYMVADTIHQSPASLENAEWNLLADRVQGLSPGGRDSMTLDIALTGDAASIPHYVMFDRWADVADWALIAFAPKDKVDHAMDVQMEEEEINLQVAEGGSTVVQTVIHNRGTMDSILRLEKSPPWFVLVSEHQEEYGIKAGGTLVLEFKVEAAGIAGSATSLIAFAVKDDDYPDCFFEHLITSKISMQVVYEEDLNQLDSLRPYGFVLAAVVFFSASACFVWVVVKRRHRVVRASQPLFLHVICAGIAVMGLAIIPMGIDDAVASERGCTIACMAMPWLLSLGFSILFAALYSKIWRINQIVKACQNFQRANVALHHVLVPFFVIFTANVAVLTLWTTLDPLVWVRETRDDSGRSKESTSYGSCSFQGNPASITFGVLLLAVNFLALVLALVELYRARNISMEYSESKYIAIAIGSNLQVFLTGLPILVLVNDSPQLLYFVKSSLVFALAISMLLLIFVPKVLMMRSNSVIEVRSSQGSKSGLRRDPESIESKGVLAHRSIGPFTQSNIRDETRFSAAENPCATDPHSSPHTASGSPARDMNFPNFSDLTESMPPSQFESQAFNSIQEDDLTASSSKVWRENSAYRSSRNAAMPRRGPSIVEEGPLSNGKDLSRSLSNQGAPRKPCRVASIAEQPEEESTTNPDVWSDFRSSGSQSNASKPIRLASEVESSIDNPKTNASVAPTATVTSASGSNASMPIRLPSVVESTVNTDQVPPESAVTVNGSCLEERFV